MAADDGHGRPSLERARDGKAFEWSKRDEEFVKRAGFVLMARLAGASRRATDEQCETFFAPIRREAHDDRNFVKKAVNWALREIGKRNLTMNRKAIRFAKEIAKLDLRPARWIATDALRELTSDAVQARLRKKAK